MPLFEILYLITASLLALYGFNSLLLTAVYWRNRKKIAARPAEFSGDVYPTVTVQLPVFNERHVVSRLIEAVAALNWPAGRLEIQILDDSTDDTPGIIAQTIARCRNKGAAMAISHIRRKKRSGYKAGALSYGLKQARGEFIAIFDADFVPTANFLQQTIPSFADERVGCVQTRWTHLNAESSALTKAQALGIDGHFVVEQNARHSIGAFLNFNGTAGLWRKACIVNAGGWQGDTLTEDLDLSYRAQFKGWQVVYLPQVTVPAELPIQLSAFKRQQFRWAKGSIQTAIKLLVPLWKIPQPAWLKILGTVHLSNYLVHPLMLLNLLLTLPMMLSNSPILQLAPLFITSAVGPPLLYWAAMAQGKKQPVHIRLGYLGMLIALGTGLSLNNTRAVIEAVLAIDSPFKRTPKFAVTDEASNWQASAYALPAEITAWLEAVLGAYALALLSWVVLQGIWWLAPWMLLYTAGYGYVSGLAFVQGWQMNRLRLRQKEAFNQK